MRLPRGIATPGFFLFSFLLSVWSGKAQAGEWPTWEFTGNTATSFMRTNQGGTGSDFWSVSLGVNYFLQPWFEWGVTGGFIDTIANGNSTSIVQVLVGPTLNFLGKTPENACFFTLQGGIEWFGNGESNPNATTLSYLIGFGRRFELVEHLSWAPELALTGNSKSEATPYYTQPSSTTYEFIPFQFSLSF